MPGDISSTPLLATERLEAAVQDRLAASPDASPVNILIVDDEPRNLIVLETILDHPSYRMVRAGSADDALVALLREDFALLILDIRMPGLSGFELAQIIKERKKTALVPIIFLTAYYSEDQHVLQGYVSGAVDYLHKPVNPAVLRSKVAIFAELYRKNREVELANDALRAEVVDRLRAEDRLRELNVTLEQRVQDRTQELRDSERHYRDMIDALPAAVYTTDEQGFLTHFNPAARALAGRTPALGKDQWCVSSKLYQSDAKPLAHENSPMAQALRTGRAIREAELLLEQPDGKRFGVMAYSTPKIDATGAVIGGINILVDITARKRAEDQIRLLMREVNHRSKNVLAVVTAIARQTATNNSTEFVRSFSDRVSALAASHDLLVKNDWQGVEIADLVRKQLAHFADLVDRRIVLAGPSARVTATAAQSIGMVVHELATNAAKHGALSNEDGLIEIAWQIEIDEADNDFAMQWTERDGPPVAKPEHCGFGSTVIKRMVEVSLDGEVELDYAPSGFRWRLKCPLAKALETV
jgi:PAS domain S-box-containing protein